MLCLAAAIAAQPGCDPSLCDPKAPCQNPQDFKCCYGNKTAAVMGGVDFVDVAVRSGHFPRDPPTFSDLAYIQTLNGYTFGFVSQANADTFAADPWSYAPAYGGF